MNIELVQAAFDLFVETQPLDTMSADDPRFEDLYNKECQIFALFGCMTDDEMAEYRRKVSLVA